jgi:RHH-type proline utilization regulon transcriptional repressor/proline dehydrogenase/delta 1-pyrroline-5-carboxylate dehydrogenase
LTSVARRRDTSRPARSRGAGQAVSDAPGAEGEPAGDKLLTSTERERMEAARPDEAEVRETARKIAALGGKAESRAYRMSFFTERAMRWAMTMPAFQTELFRFVDAFPAMAGDADVERHVREYFSGPEIPRTARAAVSLATRLPGGAHITATAARRNIAKMAGQFIIGEDPAGVVDALGDLWRGGTAAMIDLLGEHTHSHAEADRYAAAMGQLVQALLDAAAGWPPNELLESDDRGPVPRVAVAIKPTALAPDYTPLTMDAGIETARRRLTPILAMAAGRGAQVWFDMERYPMKHLTHRLFRELVEDPSLTGLHAGIVVQAYLRDSFEDLRSVVEWSAARVAGGLPPVSVRLVKGAYWDTESIVANAASWQVPVYSEKSQSDLNFERCVRYMHAHHNDIRAAFGSHNLRSLAYAITSARRAGVPDNGFEIQLIHGMAEPVHEAVRRMGLRLRVYAPMGELVPGMAYLVRRLLENTSSASFVRLRFAEGQSLDSLVAPPKASALPAPASVAVVHETDPVAPSPYRPTPPAEWWREEQRQAMARAIAGAEAGLGAEVPGVIGSQEVRTERTIVSVDPADPSRVVAVSASCSPAEADRAVAAGTEAFEAWSRTPAVERAAVLFRAAEWMRRRRFEIAALQVFEAGKGWADADGDVTEAIDFCEYYGREMLRLDAGGAVQSPPGEENRLTYRGRGVGLVIAPWNFPLAIPTGMVCAALVTGNCVVFKPAEQTPAIAAKLVEALRAGGLPDGVLSFLPGVGEEVGAYLVSHPGIAFVAFTGSKAVGLAINEAAAKTVPGQREVRRVVAEMGGKNALVIDSDADLDEAVPAALVSAFGFQGQRCSAASRLVVLDSVHDAFVERLVEATRALTMGHPREMGTELGPVIEEDAVKRIRGWQERAETFGRVVLQRDDLPERGYFVGPTIVDDVDPASPLAQEEIFGPVVAVLRAKTFEDAIRVANGIDYALTAGVISRSPSHIRLASEELRGGNIYVNRTIIGAVVGRQPFGGHAMSGLGSKAGGPDYLMQFVNPRVVTENTLRQGFAPSSSPASTADRGTGL